MPPGTVLSGQGWISNLARKKNRIYISNTTGQRQVSLFGLTDLLSLTGLSNIKPTRPLLYEKELLHIESLQVMPMRHEISLELFGHVISLFVKSRNNFSHEEGCGIILFAVRRFLRPILRRLDGRCHF